MQCVYQYMCAMPFSVSAPWSEICCFVNKQIYCKQPRSLGAQLHTWHNTDAWDKCQTRPHPSAEPHSNLEPTWSPEPFQPLLSFISNAGHAEFWPLQCSLQHTSGGTGCTAEWFRPEEILLMDTQKISQLNDEEGARL